MGREEWLDYKEIAFRAQRILDLVGNPQPGLYSWWMFFAQEYTKLKEAVEGEGLGKDDASHAANIEEVEGTGE